MGVLFSWWLAIELLGIVGLPLTATLFANLPDRGWSLSKPLSLLLLGWLIWFPLSLITALPFNRGWIIGTALLFALGNAALLRRRETLGALRRLLTRHWGYVALNEGLFAGAFALMAWVRSFTPAVVDTEKFMDVAFLSAIWRTSHLPPPDPWLSGQPINYYYFGHYLMALPAKTLGTQPSVAFNVAVALTFALAATAIFGVATNIAAVARSAPTISAIRSAAILGGRRATSRSTNAADGEMSNGRAASTLPTHTREDRGTSGVVDGDWGGARRGAATAEDGGATGDAAGVRLMAPLLPPAIAGIVTVILTLIVGNLNGAQVWYHVASGLSGPGQPLHGNPWAWWTQRDLWPQYDWWAPSRVVPNTINEFPAFSFALADLHAHVLALPFAALAIGLAFNLALASGQGIGAFGRRGVGMLCLAVSGVVLGSLYAINGWDLPTYVGLAVLALLIQQWLAHERVIDSVLLINVATAILMLVALGLIFYFPFYRGFSSPSLGVGIVPASQHTPIGYEIAIFGLPLFLAISWLARDLTPWPPLPRGEGALTAALRWPWVVGGAVVLLALVTWRTLGGELWTIFWGLLVIGVCAWLALRKLDFHLTWGAEDDEDSDNSPSPRGRGGQGVRSRAERADLDADEGAPTLTGQPLRWSDRAGIWVYVLIGTATALVVVCELIYLRDIFGGAPDKLGVDFRMNTVFKLYYQAWLIFGVVSGPLVVWLTAAAWRSLTTVAAPLATVRQLAQSVAGGADDEGGPQGALAFRALSFQSLAAPILTLYRRWARWREAAPTSNARLALAASSSGASVVNGRIALASRASSSRSGAARRGAKATSGGKGSSRGAASTDGKKPTMQTRQGKPMPAARPIRQPGAPASQGNGATGEGRGDDRRPANNRPEDNRPAVETAPEGLAATTSADADLDQAPSPTSWRGAGGQPEIRDWLRAGVGAAWLVALMALVALALIYPVMAVAARSDNLTLPRSLDGTAYMATDTMNSGDQYAIAWLNTHVSGDPVIVEAATYNEYTHLGRVSAFTGLPTLMGWGGHEVQWRYNWLSQPGRGDLIGQRLDAVNQIYTNPHNNTVLALLHQYDVRFVYVGAAERNTYINANLTRFAAFLRVVYHYDGVTIYEVPV